MTDWPGRRVSTGPALAVRATSPTSPYARDRVEAPSNRPAARTPTLRSRTQDVVRSAPGALAAARERQVYDTTWSDVGRGAQELTGLPSLARGAGGLAALPAVARSGFLGPQHALPAAGALAETALGLAGPMMLPRSAGRVAAPVATEAAQPIPRIAREIGPNGMPIAQSQPYRNSLRGGSSDLREAAGMGARPTNGPIRAYHGSPDDIDAFRPGTHFGTSDAASQRLRDNRVTDGGRIYPVDLPQGQYLRVPEAGNMWDNAEWWQTQARADIHTPMSREQRALWDAIENDRALSQARGPAVAERLGQIMREHGFEGASYHNRWEGGDSYFMPDASRARMALSSPPPTTPTGTSPFGDPRAYPQSAWEEFGSLQGGTPEARVPRRVFDLPHGDGYGTGTFEALQNPTRDQLTRLARRDLQSPAMRGVRRTGDPLDYHELRYIRDADGNIYVSSGVDVEHMHMADGLRAQGVNIGEGTRGAYGASHLQYRDGQWQIEGHRRNAQGVGESFYEPYGAAPPQPLRGGTPEARLRAQEQGFDTGRVLYHGTRQNVEGAFRPSDVGAFGPGVYVSDDASVASRYAGMGGGEGGNVIPTFTREGRYATPQQFEDAANAAARAGVGKRSLAYERAAQDLANQGYTGVQDGHVTSVFDPRNIRSIFAAFDPAKRDSSDLLALTNDPAADPMISRAGALRGLAASEGPRLPPPGNEDRYLFGRPPAPTPMPPSLVDLVDDGGGNLIVGAMRRAGVNIQRAEDSGLLDRPMTQRAIPITQLRGTDHTRPAREWVDMFKEDPSEFYPIQVRQRGRNRYDIIDGHHRTQAAREMGQTEIDAYDASIYFPEIRNRWTLAAPAGAVPLSGSAALSQPHQGRPQRRPSDSQRSRGAFDRTGR